MTQEQPTLISLNTDIVEYKPFNIATLFEEGGTDDLLDEIEKAIDTFDYDLSSGVKRKEIASLSSKVSKTKTFLEGQGKELKKNLEDQIKPVLDQIAVVDAERSKLKKRCDALRDKAREPLTKWEEEEQKRKDELDKKLYDLEQMENFSQSDHAEYEKISESISARIEAVKEVAIDGTWEEHAQAAAKVKESVLNRLEDMLAQQREHEAKEEELEKLRAEKAELQQKEAERKAQEEADAKAKENAQKEIDEAKEAQIRAEKDAENAREEERKKIEREKLEEEKAAKEREADQEHRGKINREARDEIAGILHNHMGEEEGRAIATQVLTAIVKGNIPHVSIRY